MKAGPRSAARRAAALAVAHRVLDASDPLNFEAWHGLLWPATHMRIGNRPLALNREAALKELKMLMAEVTTFGRGFRAVWPGHDGETVLMELDAQRRDGVAMPLAIVLRALSPDPPIRDIRFYIDLSGLTLGKVKSRR